jgi:hypothetical protein
LINRLKSLSSIPLIDIKILSPGPTLYSCGSMTPSEACINFEKELSENELNDLSGYDGKICATLNDEIKIKNDNKNIL